jgi:hypothetical protein
MAPDRLAKAVRFSLKKLKVGRPSLPHIAFELPNKIGCPQQIP